MTETTKPPTAPPARPPASGSAAELIGRYVREVTRRLPRKQRDDVGRELRSSLLDALEDRFGAEPTWVHAAVLLRENGPPARVAASYRPADQYLIGPGWYPFFTFVLRIVLTAYVAVLVGGFALTLVLRSDSGDVAGTLSGLLDGLFQGGLIAFGIVVAIFHLLDRSEPPPERAERWDPEDLPAVEESDVVGRGEAVLGIVLPAGFLILLWSVRDSLGLELNPGGRLLLGDLFRAHLPWVSAAILLDMAYGAWLVWRGRHSGGSRAVKLAIDLFTLLVFARIATDVTAARPEMIAAGLPEDLANFVGWLSWSPPVVIAILVLVGLGKLAWRALRRPAEAV